MAGDGHGLVSIASPAPAILALQGSVEPHVESLRRIGSTPVEVRRPEQLAGVTHLVLPGGESTTLYKLLELYGLWEPLAARARQGELAVFGTCAGAILLGRPADERPPRLGIIDITVKRNAYGSQIDSFTAPLHVAGRSAARVIEGVFIRSPRMSDPGPEVEVLAQHDGEPVLVRQGRCLAATFHPELTPDSSLHEYFLEL